MSRGTRFMMLLLAVGAVVACIAVVALMRAVLEPAVVGGTNWLHERVGPWPIGLGLLAIVIGGWWFGRESQRKHDAAQYARDRTIHVERPNWWRQPVRGTRVPRVVAYYAGAAAFVLLIVASASSVPPRSEPGVKEVASASPAPRPRFNGILVEPQPTR